MTRVKVWAAYMSDNNIRYNVQLWWVVLHYDQKLWYIITVNFTVVAHERLIHDMKILGNIGNYHTRLNQLNHYLQGHKVQETQICQDSINIVIDGLGKLLSRIRCVVNKPRSCRASPLIEHGTTHKIGRIPDAEISLMNCESMRTTPNYYTRTYNSFTTLIQVTYLREDVY
jgi:hypothetical protein